MKININLHIRTHTHTHMYTCGEKFYIPLSPSVTGKPEVQTFEAPNNSNFLNLEMSHMNYIVVGEWG